jgi:hypothetical protein
MGNKTFVKIEDNAINDPHPVPSNLLVICANA